MILSDILGYTSIGCWLFAQFPQVLENIRQQSVDGLALPFLLNWLLGDLTNLIGCILTHQLPFQTYLATYFCFVDFSLLSQFFYYRSNKKGTRTSTVSSFAHGPSHTISATSRGTSSERPATRYRAISAVAANVAAAAALAAQDEAQQPPRHGHGRWNTYTADGSTSRVHTSEERAEDEDEVDDEALARLADSFHSDGGQSARRKRVSWSKERYDSRGASLARSMQSPRSPVAHIQPLTAVEGLPMQTSDFDVSIRGRSRQREADVMDPGVGEWHRERSFSAQRRSSRASRRSASIVFLGVFALFGIGSLSGGHRGTYSTSREGYVVSAPNYAPLNISNPMHPEIAIPMTEAVLYGSPGSSENFNEPSTEQVIGRIFAWSCTTLYLTSRLPQIWKNYTRKSVEGLSVFLFLFAFLGNSFYVASILTSPKMYLPPPLASEFIKESIPYLLGSGGTLMFDVTIVTQTFLYRPKAHSRLSTRSRSATITRRDDEETGLLSGDVLAQSHDRAQSRDSAYFARRGRTPSTRTSS